MAQLKDTLVTGNLQVTNTILSSSLQSSIIRAPIASNSSTYGAGEDGHVLQSNGSSIFWGKLSTSNIDGINNYLLKTEIIFPTSTPILSWNTESTIFTINGTAVKIKAMTKPTYSATDIGLGNVTNEAQITKNTFTEPYQIMYSTSANTPAVLAANKTTTKKFLTMTGANTTTGAAPVWNTIAATDIVEGALSITHGGTGAITPAGARAELGTPPYIQGVFYGTCGTAAATKLKQVELINGEGFTLSTGVVIFVKFTNASAAATMTMEISADNGTTYCAAKNLYRYATTTMSSGTTTNGWRAGAVVGFVYDGTGWERIFWENSTYSVYNQIYCATAADETEKVGTGPYYTNENDEYSHYFMVTIVYSNTEAQALTLNINSKGAKPIYINGSPSSTTNYTLPAGYYLVYYDGSYYHFRTDNKIPGKITNTALQDYIQVYEFTTQWTGGSSLELGAGDMFFPTDTLIVGPGSTSDTTVHSAIISAQFEFNLVLGNDNEYHLYAQAMGTAPSSGTTIPFVVVRTRGLKQTI